MGYFDKADKYAIFPGFCDVHVHFREPGFFYKESILTGSKAAARGGYTAVCTMPNLNPVSDSTEHLKAQLDIIERDSVIDIYPYGAITVGQNGKKIADLEGMAPLAVAFSDDGHGVQDESLMKEAMLRAKALGKVITAHCEDNSLLNGGYIHDGIYARLHGHKGICSKSEWVQIERDVKLAAETGCAYHVCHVSCKESVDIIRKAKAAGADVTCETAPHYLLLNEEDLKEDGRFKMNPPLRGKDDRLALIEGIKDGTIDMIATDHAPHSKEEKAKGLEGSAFGIVGLETAFPLLYTNLVLEGVISLEALIKLMCENPRKRFGIEDGTKTGLFETGGKEEIFGKERTAGRNYCVWNLSEEYEIKPDEFLSKGRATPFEGRRVFGRCVKTVCDGQVAYEI